MLDPPPMRLRARAFFDGILEVQFRNLADAVITILQAAEHPPVGVAVVFRTAILRDAAGTVVEVGAKGTEYELPRDLDILGLDRLALIDGDLKRVPFKLDGRRKIAPVETRLLFRGFRFLVPRPARPEVGSGIGPLNEFEPCKLPQI